MPGNTILGKKKTQKNQNKTTTPTTTTTKNDLRQAKCFRNVRTSYRNFHANLAREQRWQERVS